MATVDLQALRELVSEVVARDGDTEWIIRLGDITHDVPASFALDIDTAQWFTTMQVFATGDLVYEQIAFDGGKSTAAEEHTALSQEALLEHITRIVAAQKPRPRRE